jgi:hypothetical protein
MLVTKLYLQPFHRECLHPHLNLRVKSCRFPKLVFLSLLAVASATCRAQQARFVGESLVITDGARRIRLAEVIEPHPEYRVVHSVQKRGADYFVVIGVSEWTRGYPPRDGNCGGGIESHIDWLHVRDSEIVERKSGLYESCRINREGYTIAWRRGLLHWTSQGARSAEVDGRTVIIPVKYTWTFDPAHPENGIEEHAEDGKPAKSEQ